MTSRRVFGSLITAAALVLAAGCAGSPSGGSSGSSGSSRVEKPDLTIAVVPSADSAGFFIALHQGLFTAQGLHVRFVPVISSETAIDAQVAGRYDVTGGNYVSYIQAQQAGRANLDIVAEGSVMQPGSMGIYTMPGSRITTLTQLKSRRVAINAPNNIMYLLAASVLAEHGVPPSSVHFVIPQGGFPTMAAGLKANAFDAAALPEPFGSIAESTDGAVPLADLNQGATAAFPVLGYVVTKQWAQRYPRTLAAFYRALEAGQQIADNDRSAVEAALESLPQPLGVPKTTAAFLAVDSYPVSTGPAGAVDRIRLQRVVDVMHQFIGFPTFNLATMLLGS